MAEKRAALEVERRGLVDRIEELDDVRRRHEARRDLLEARRQDIEETAGSRFLTGRKGRAIGLLKDLVRVEAGLERALVSALGPLADAVVYEDAERAIADAPEGDGAILAIASGGPVPAGLSGERRLLAAVDAEPAARGIASTILRDVYLASTVAEAAEKQRAHRQASFVTPEGVLVGPAVIHTARQADARSREIRAELQVVAHDLTRHAAGAEAEARAPRRDRRRSRLPAGADRGRRRGDHRRRRAPRRPRARSDGAAQGRGTARPATRRARRGGGGRQGAAGLARSGLGRPGAGPAADAAAADLGQGGGRNAPAGPGGARRPAHGAACRARRSVGARSGRPAGGARGRRATPETRRRPRSRAPRRPPRRRRRVRESRRHRGSVPWPSGRQP